ncbi:MAG: ATPase, T2SS/T4P/T4SS family [Gallionella sp.]|nr:ATPase, T2SS/T4P/T4SS family [Gallionella sp.]
MDENGNEETIQFLERCIKDAYHACAFDIYFEQLTDACARVRFKIDGVMQDYRQELPLTVYSVIIAHLKVLAGLHTADRKMPLYAQVSSAKFARINLELGCSFIPTTTGVDLSIRILYTGEPLPLEKFGLRAFDLDAIRAVRGGVVLFAGTKSSGRQTLLWSALSDRNQQQQKVCSVRDVESVSPIPGLCETDARPGSGYSYEGWMKALVRMDADVIHIGTLTGEDKLFMAAEAALDGVTVMADMYANNAVDAIAGYLDSGKNVSARTLVAALSCVVYQHLLPRLCPDCKEASRLDEEDIKNLLLTGEGSPPEVVQATLERWLTEYGGKESVLLKYRARGCDNCAGTGYRGRVAVFEVVVATPGIKAQLLSHASDASILKLALQEGTFTMRQDAIEKALAGKIDFSAACQIKSAV